MVSRNPLGKAVDVDEDDGSPKILGSAEVVVPILPETISVTLLVQLILCF